MALYYRSPSGDTVEQLQEWAATCGAVLLRETVERGPDGLYRGLAVDIETFSKHLLLTARDAADAAQGMRP